MIKENNVITLTIVSMMTMNYSESLGNLSSIQKVIQNGQIYGKRTKESLKYHIMNQSGLYDSETTVDGATQRTSTDKMNISNCPGLEGGYMSTKGKTIKRNSSFYVSDGISVDIFPGNYEFHNNLGLSTEFANQNGLKLGKDDKKCGLMPYSYEYQKNLVVYSITIDLNRIGIDENFGINITNEEKIDRVIRLLTSVRDLSLVVKGSLDNSTPRFIIGGFSKIKTHVFEPYVKIRDNELLLTDSLLMKLKQNNSCRVGMIDETFKNDKEIKETFDVMNVDEFFDQLFEEVKEYYS